MSAGRESNAGRAPVFSAAALARTLLVADAGEAFSPIGGPGVLVLDLDRSAEEANGSGADERARLLAELPRLPCVTIAIGGRRPLPASTTPFARRAAESDEGDAERVELSTLAAACDVWLAGEEAEGDALETLLMGFENTPCAALAFVQLLRGATPARSIAEGLVAESFVYSTLQSGPEFQRWLTARGARRAGRAAGRPGPARVETGPACRIARERDRLEIRFDRPRKHNAFSRALRDALTEALVVALADPSLEEIVLTGEGESFCSGGDLDEFGSFPDPATAHVVRTTRSPALLLSRLAGRVRSEIHGACIGAGIELPAFTDRIVADEDTFIALPEVGLGLVPGAGGTVSLPRRIGRQRTAWLGLSGQRLDARKALDWGLVDEVRLRQHPAPRNAPR